MAAPASAVGQRWSSPGSVEVQRSSKIGLGAVARDKDGMVGR